MATLAFIGLGNMGRPMAVNLVKAGHTVTVFDLESTACAQLRDVGANVAEVMVDAVEGVDAVISMLPAGDHVADVYLGENGLLGKLDRSAMVLDCSTIDAVTAKEVAVAAKVLGIDFMDCPVSGGVAAATAGSLAFMCGGTHDTFERAKRVLTDMGKNIFHAGPHGAGQVAKACNNMCLAIHMIGTSESLEMGVRNGLDPKVLSEIMLASSGRNWSLEAYNPYPGVMENTPSSNNYKPGFMVDLMAKDLGLAMDIADNSNSSNPMGRLAQTLYTEHQQAGNGKKDFSSILEKLQQ